MCIVSVYALLKVVGYYDLSVLSMSVMGFQKKFVWRVDGWVYTILFWIFGEKNYFANSLAYVGAYCRVYSIVFMD